MQGVTHGFRITNKDTERAGAFFPNHRSALDPSCKEAVQRQIQVEIDNGRYRVVDFKPSIVSGLAAIPKSDGTVRLLHDASRPAGVALNDYAVNEPFNYQTVEQAAASINHGDILAKVDLSSAYRSVKIHPEDSPVRVGVGIRRWQDDLFSGQAVDVWRAAQCIHLQQFEPSCL